jgi:hypothetical protein
MTPVPKPAPRVKHAKKPVKRTAVKRVNRKRKASEFQRTYGGKARVEWVKSLPCCAVNGLFHIGPIENAHITTDGMGRKADAQCIVPLCAGHHAFLHRRGAKAIREFLAAPFSKIARETEAAWQAHLAAST